RLDGIETQKGFKLEFRLSHLGEGRGIAHLLRPGPQRIGVEREHHLRAVEMRQRRERPPEGKCGARAGRIVVDRLIAQPTRLWKNAGERLELADQGRRGDTPGDNAQAGAAPRPFFFKLRLQYSLEGAPGGEVVAVL